MHYLLLWIEGLSVALLFASTATAWPPATQRRFYKKLWTSSMVLVPMAVYLPMLYFSYLLFHRDLEPSWLFLYMLALTISYFIGIVLIIQRNRAIKVREPDYIAKVKEYRVLAFISVLALFVITVSLLYFSVIYKLANIQSKAKSTIVASFSARVPDKDNAALIYEKAIERFGEEDFPDKYRHSPDIDPLSDEVVKYLKGKQDVLDILDQAAEKDVFYVEHDLLDPGWPLSFIGELKFGDYREMANLLSLDARNCAARGNQTGAMERVMAIQKMAKHLGQIPFMIHLMISCAIDGIALETFEMVIDDAENKPLLFDALEEDALRNCSRDIKRTLQGEEGFMLHNLVANDIALIPYGFSMLFSDCKLLPCKDPGGMQLFLYRIIKPFWYIFMLPEEIDLNKGRFEPFRELQEIVSQPYYKSFEDLEDWKFRLENEIRGLIISYSFIDFSSYTNRKIKVMAKYRVARLASAVNHYKIQKQVYPASLEELMPDYISEIPLDPFDGEPLKITVVDDGIVIYSIGLNRIDENGRDHDFEDGDDITFCLGAAYKKRRSKDS